MMTSSNGNIFHFTDPLWGEFTDHPWIPLHKCQWRGALMFSLICAWTNGWANNWDAGDLRRHLAHYVAIVMGVAFTSILKKNDRVIKRFYFIILLIQYPTFWRRPRSIPYRVLTTLVDRLHKTCVVLGRPDWFDPLSSLEDYSPEFVDFDTWQGWPESWGEGMSIIKLTLHTVILLLLRQYDVT